MDIKNQIRETVGHAREELGEALGDKDMMYKGRHQRNIGKVKQGERPILSEPGSKNKD